MESCRDEGFAGCWISEAELAVTTDTFDYTGGEFDQVLHDDGEDEIRVIKICYCPVCSRSNSAVEYRRGTRPKEADGCAFVYVEELEAPCASHFL